MTKSVVLCLLTRRRSKIPSMGNKMDWDYSGILTTSSSERGGWRDSIIKFFSFGFLGIETTKITPDILVRPTLSPEIPGMKSIQQGTLVMKLNKSVTIYDFREFNSPQIKRKLVFNKQ